MVVQFENHKGERHAQINRQRAQREAAIRRESRCRHAKLKAAGEMVNEAAKIAVS